MTAFYVYSHRCYEYLGQDKNKSNKKENRTQGFLTKTV